jgi:hypothetical protein
VKKMGKNMERFHAEVSNRSVTNSMNREKKYVRCIQDQTENPVAVKSRKATILQALA